MPQTCPQCNVPLSADDNASTTCPSCGSRRSTGVADMKTLTLPSKSQTSPHLAQVQGNRRVANNSPSQQFGDYLIEQELARGGMGVVYRARQVSLNRPVALKMILSSQLASADEIRRFHVEAEAAARLDHPGIVPVYEVGEIGGRHFFSMSLVEGGSLASLVQQGPLACRRAAQLVQQIAEAVQYAHARNIVHRDLKPANVLLDELGRPKVSDFGLAKNILEDSGMTATGQVMGTPSYMAPEQAAGRSAEVGTLADVYALGGILYFLVTAQPPFKGRTSHETIQQVLHREVESPRRHNPRVDLDLETICRKCLEKEGRNRYASAKELADELGRYLRGEPIQARPLPTSARAWRWARRNPLIAGLATAAALALVVGIAVSSFFASSATKRANEAQTNLGKAETQRQRADAKTVEAEGNLAKAETLRHQAERLAYSSQLALSQREWEVGDVDHARQVLAACQPDLRGWEHAYLNTLFNGGHRDFAGHAGPVYSLAFSPDSQKLLSGGYLLPQSGEMQLRNLADGQLLQSFPGLTDTGVTRGVAYVEGGKLIVSASAIGTINVWDSTTFELVRSIPAHRGGINCLAASENSHRLATGSGMIFVGGERNGQRNPGEVKIWDWTTGQETVQVSGHEGPVAAVAFSPDGFRLAAVANNGQTKVWNITTGEELHAWQVPGGPSTCVAFSRDGQQLYVGSAGPKNVVKVCDISTGKLLRELSSHTRTINCVAVSPDGRWIVSGAGSPHGQAGEIKLWDAEKGTEIRSFKGSNYSVAAVEFSADSQHFASGGGKFGRPGELKVWQVAPANDRQLSQHSGQCIAYHASNRQVVSGFYDGSIKIWDADTQRELHSLAAYAGPLLAVAFLAGSDEIVAVGQKTAPLPYNAAAGTPPAPEFLLKRFNLQNQQELSSFTSLPPIAMHASGRHMAVAEGEYGQPAILKIIDTTSGQAVQQLTDHTSSVAIGAFDATAARFASGSADGSLKIWDLASGECTLTIAAHETAVSALNFSHDGRWVISGGYDTFIRVWDLSSGKLLRQQSGHTTTVTSVATSADGQRIVSCGHHNLDPGEIKIWEAATGHDLLTLKYSARRALFSPDGSNLLTLGAIGPVQGAIKIWDARLVHP